MQLPVPFSGDVAAPKVELRSKKILSKHFPKKRKIRMPAKRGEFGTVLEIKTALELVCLHCLSCDIKIPTDSGT